MFIVPPNLSANIILAILFICVNKSCRMNIIKKLNANQSPYRLYIDFCNICIVIEYPIIYNIYILYVMRNGRW